MHAGESIPQLKESVAWDEATQRSALDMRLDNKACSARVFICYHSVQINILFGGTRILQQSAAAVRIIMLGDSNHAQQVDAGHPDTVPNASDGGCLCFVLRTGFASSQVSSCGNAYDIHMIRARWCA